MSLGFGRGPLGGDGGTWSVKLPDRVWYLEEWPRRMRAVFNGRAILDSRRGKLLHQAGSFPVHWFPADDIDRDLLVPAGSSEPGSDGDTRQRFDVRVGSQTAREAATAIIAAGSDGPPLTDHLSIEFSAMDRWFEEDEPLYAHARDPYHRVDVRASSQKVVARIDDTVLAETARPKLLFETSNPVRHYLPFADVNIGYLQRSDTVSECPYKGDGQHWNVVIDGRQVDNAAWSLPHPLPEGLAAAEHVCFYPDKVTVEVDGQRIEA